MELIIIAAIAWHYIVDEPRNVTPPAPTTVSEELDDLKREIRDYRNCVQYVDRSGFIC